MSEHKTLSIDNRTYERLNELASLNGRSIVGQIRWMLDHYVEVHNIPRPADAEPIQLITIQEA